MINSMDPLYSYSGGLIGFQTGDRVFSQSGRQIGKIVQGAVYSPDGKYFGSINGNRIGYNLSKSRNRLSGFVPVIIHPLQKQYNRPPAPLPSGFKNTGADEPVKDVKRRSPFTLGRKRNNEEE